MKKKSEEMDTKKVLTEEEFQKLKAENELEAKKIKIREDMVKLIKSYYKEGKISDLDMIIKGFEPLMWKLAKPYRFSVSARFGRLELVDYVQEAKLELIENLKNKTYKPSKGAPSTFFFKLIVNKYIDLNNENSSAFKFSKTARDKLKGIAKYQELLTNGAKPAVALRKSKIRKKDLLKWENRKCINIDSTIKNYDDGSETSYQEIIPDKNQEKQGEALIKAEFYALIKRNLTNIEYEFLIDNNINNLAMREIAEKNNIEEYIVRKTLESAMNKLRNCEELKTYIGAFGGNN